MSDGVAGKVVVITGGSSGIGAAAARALRAGGAHVILTGRSPGTAALARELGAEHHLVDYARLASVRAFAHGLLASTPRIDVLVNNVGGLIGERRVTEDGHELTFQVNHLAGFLLTLLLRDRLLASRGLVVNTSSMAHHWGTVDLEDLETARRTYAPLKVYGAAKRMNVLHALELPRRFPGVAAASFHPGVVWSGFGREARGLTRWFYESALTRPLLRTPEQGADTLVWLAGAQPGRDFTPGGFYARRKPARVHRQVSPALAAALWDASARLVA